VEIAEPKSQEKKIEHSHDIDPHAESRRKLTEKLKAKGKMYKESKEVRPPSRTVEDKSATKTDTKIMNDKMRVAELFTKCLTPFFKSGRIACKATFKVLAREFTHVTVRAGRQVDAGSVALLLDRFFREQEGPVGQERARDLVTAFRLL
jgi:hypothetical protein